MSENHITTGTGTAIAKMIPAVSGVTYAGFTMNEWAALATIVYVLMQTILLLPKYAAWFRRKFAGRGGE